MSAKNCFSDLLMQLGFIELSDYNSIKRSINCSLSRHYKSKNINFK